MKGGQFVLALDVGGTNIRMALVDRQGRITHSRHRKCAIDKGREAFVARLNDDIHTLHQEADQSNATILAAGAGVPGLIARDGTILTSVNLQPLNGLNFRTALQEMTSVPTVVLNDANAAACGEKWYGSGHVFDSILMLTIGTGVGSGLILDNRLWTGSDGVAGEYGHMTVEPDGVLCACGNHGCLEQYASATALARMAREALDAGTESSLAGLSPTRLTAAAIAGAAKDGDRLALALFERAATALGIAAATAANLLNPDALILGGGVAASFDLLAPTISRTVKERAFPVPAGRLQILKGVLGDDAGLMGAAAMAWQLLDGTQN